VAGDVLIDRALARATLARQLLLRRARLPPLEAVEHLVGLQAQEPLDPYIGLWTRLEGFDPEALARLLEERRVVRTVLMRSTIHLVTAVDCLWIRPLVEPVLAAEIRRHSVHAPALRDVDLAPVLRLARKLLAERPLAPAALGEALAQRFPGRAPASLAAACRNHLALVQVPPRGLWGRTGRVRLTTAEAWLGRPLARDASLDDLFVRYLGAFGPASVADATTWSRLTGLRGVFERMRARLRVFRDGRGRELFDLPDAPRPDAETPAPTRFLPEFDNVVLSHADRNRFVSDDERARFPRVPGRVRPLLHDGRLRAAWRLDAAALVVTPLGPLPRSARAEIADEGERLLDFLGVEGRDIRFVEAY
jgi:winged helix DNA-binding protein